MRPRIRGASESRSPTPGPRASGRFREDARPPSAAVESAPFDIVVTDLALSGEAYAESRGETIYVEGAIPGEKVRVRIVPRGEASRWPEAKLRAGPRPGFALARGQAGARDRGDDGVKAELLSVLEPSPHRMPPACPHAALCGGCSFQHIAYPEQLRLKTRLLDGLLADAFGPDRPKISPMIGMPVSEDGVPRRFRQKAAFGFTEDAKGQLQLGHFARGTHKIIPVTECLVHSDRANRVAFAIKDAMAKARVPVATERSGLLRHVVVRVSEDEKEAVAVVVSAEEHRALEAPLRAIANSRDKPEGLLLNLHDQPSPYLFGPHTVRIDGTGHVKETALGPSFLASPTGFFQTNIQGAAHLVRLVMEAMGAGKSLRILDLYSGSGLFALPLALASHNVTAVEESRKASREAAKNAQLSGVPESRLRLIPSKVEDAIDHLIPQEWDAAVIDPPRSGCPEEVMRTLTRKIAPQTLVIVSCNPESLMDELRVAFDAGYRARLVQPIDMFPHTPHLETVVVLESSRRPRVKNTPDGPARREARPGPRPPAAKKPFPPKPWEAMRAGRPATSSDRPKDKTRR